jgi:uncharacterized protein
MYKRILSSPLKSNRSFFLFGPRGVGKTSWVKKNVKNSIYIDLLDTQMYFELQANPNKLEKLIPKDFKDWIIIDEVQKVPLLLNEVHRLIENYKYKFVLTGSSARSLRKKGVNLLAGRAYYYKMHPLTTLELKNDFNLKNSLLYGNLPSIYDKNIDKKKYLQTYIQTYLKEEVLQEGLTRNISAFSRFLEIASFSQGEILNVSNIAKECNLNRKLVDSYLDIVQDLLIGQKIPVFSKKAKRKLISHCKFYYFDTGVFRSIRPKGPLDISAELDGPALETLFLQEIQAINDYFELDYKIYYWRTASKHEVDFILYGENGLIAIEIKRKTNITNNDLKGLKLFLEDYPMAKTFLFYGGDKKYYENDIQIIPANEAILDIKNILENK